MVTTKEIEEIRQYGYLDEEWAEQNLPRYCIHFYRIRRIKIGRLQAARFTPNGWQFVPLQETDAFRYLNGDHKAYSRYTQYMQECKVDMIHNPIRYQALIDRCRDEGQDPRSLIVCNQEYHIRDGIHRSCLLLHTHGPRHKTCVLQFYEYHDDFSLLHPQEHL